MSSPIQPISGRAEAPAQSSFPAATVGEAGDFLSQLTAVQRIEASRGTPPHEVLDQIAAAADVHDRLRAGGAELRFERTASGGRVRIDLHSAGPGTPRTISAAEALEILAGKTAE
jgi:hypothetical protein